MRVRGGRLWVLLAALALFLTLPVLLGRPPGVPPSAAPAPAPSPATAETAARAADYRAVWVSYLEWQRMDFSSAETFLAGIGPLLDDIAALGANVVLAQVRPFGDALYPSAYYPFSHLCSGVQGQDPGYDPLALLLQAARQRGLQVEAWINPYRLQANGVPAVLAADSPANRHPDWVKSTADGLYLDPILPAVRRYIADGVAELCRSYALAGIHFDDYFYPTTDPAFDADAYAAYRAAGGTLDLEAWRRQQVDELVALCWQTVHETPGLRFGIAPQGDPETNRLTQYSDAALWLSTPGYVDYLMPQLYWGLDHPSRGLAEMAARWQALPRADGVALYAGLGAYRIGDGDGSGSDEWQRGDALARQVLALRGQGLTGVGLYRYDSLFANAAWPALAAQERAALAALWRAGD